MNYFSDKKEFLQEQVGHEGNWREILTLSKTKRKQVMKRVISGQSRSVSTMTPEKMVLHNFDIQVAELERSRLRMEASLKETKDKLRALLKKRVKLVKALDLDVKPV